MADKAREWTDKELARMEKKIDQTYKQASKELTKKWDEYMERGEKRLSSLQDAYEETLKGGNKDLIAEAKSKLQNAKKAYTLQNEQFKNMVDSVTLDMSQVNQKALSLINDQLPNIYAENHDQVKVDLDDVKIDYTLADKGTVKRMIKDGDIKLPKKKIDVPKDQRWNTKKINSSVLQGILQGEPMDKIAKRLLPIMDNNRTSAIRNARTLVTGAENRGRIDSYHELADQGIILKKVWIATGDDRTRDWHLTMDGQEVDIDEDFIDGNGNELEYPADPSAEPETVYNCRCSMRTHIVGVQNEDGSIDYIDYEHEEGLHQREIEEEKERRADDKHEETEAPVEKSEFLTRLENWGIDYKEVQDLPAKLSEDQIIEKIGGGDMTRGSCTSLSFAYAGNKSGYDVTDFRGGSSTDFFAKTINIKSIASLPNVESQFVSNINDFKAVEAIIKNLPSNKEFILSTGKHTSIIRKIENKFYYLELQSAKDNGYKQLTNTVLKQRFGCQKSHSTYGFKYEAETILIDVESLSKNQEFKNILGYINTATDAQKKGEFGHVK